MRQSKYWDDFELRVRETVGCLGNHITPPVRRVAVFVTQACNFRCAYCNVNFKPKTMSESRFREIIAQYGDNAIIHITGGEPSIVPWLYPLIEEHGDRCRFHLSTNAYIKPPCRHLKCLKVSLDSCDPTYWGKLVGVPGAWHQVVENIQEASKHAVTSITYTLTRENYWRAPNFLRSVPALFPDLYAVFFSVYKGDNPRFVFTEHDTETFFGNFVPSMKLLMDEESKALFEETISEKRLLTGLRFPDNNLAEPCYISMSERVIGPDGAESFCPHLYRDGIIGTGSKKCLKCQYRCNQRLVDFNNLVAHRLDNR